MSKKFMLIMCLFVIAPAAQAGFLDELKEVNRKLKEVNEKLKANQKNRSSQSVSPTLAGSDSSNKEPVTEDNFFDTMQSLKSHFTQVRYASDPKVNKTSLLMTLGADVRYDRCIKGEYLGIGLKDDVSVLNDIIPNWKEQIALADKNNKKIEPELRFGAPSHLRQFITKEEKSLLNLIFKPLRFGSDNSILGYRLQHTCDGAREGKCKDNISEISVQLDSEHKIAGLSVTRIFNRGTPLNRQDILSRIEKNYRQQNDPITIPRRFSRESSAGYFVDYDDKGRAYSALVDLSQNKLHVEMRCDGRSRKDKNELGRIKRQLNDTYIAILERRAKTNSAEIKL